jgi:ribose 5-phosphate isomerase B
VKWFAGSDHAGYRLKQRLCEVLRALGDEVTDLGTDSEASVDYPDYGAAVGRRVAAEPGTLGLLVCGSGNGIAMAANRIAGARAAVATCEYAARMARAHNDANVIAFGQRITGEGVAEEALRAFRESAFEGGRHQRRVDKLEALSAAPAGAPKGRD